MRRRIMAMWSSPGRARTSPRKARRCDSLPTRTRAKPSCARRPRRARPTSSRPRRSRAVTGIRVEADARGVTTVTLDRPEVSNAFDAAMLRALIAAFDEIARDDAVRVAILRGAGKHFSAGADLKAAAASHGREEIDPVAVLNLIDRCPKPTVALVQGACIGGGVAWIAACDIAIAEESAFFSIPEVRIGFCPSPMIPLFLSAMGARALRRYALSGERFGAAEALRCGLIHEVCAPGALDMAAAPVIDGLLHGAPKAAGAI